MLLNGDLYEDSDEHSSATLMTPDILSDSTDIEDVKFYTELKSNKTA